MVIKELPSRNNRKSYRHNIRNGDNSFYQSTAWKKTRNAFIAANPYCVECQKEGKKVKATVADHLKQVILDGDKHNWSNLQPLCSSHHNSRSAKQKNEMYAKKR